MTGALSTHRALVRRGREAMRLRPELERGVVLLSRATGWGRAEVESLTLAQFMRYLRIALNG